VILPKECSDELPRRGRTTVDATVNGVAFQVVAEPDGKKSHWIRLDAELLQRAEVEYGDVASFEVRAVAEEPEPAVPVDLSAALDASPAAQSTWKATSTLARVDWVHWIVSAKKEGTRSKRVRETVDKLSAGKRTVCCFDNSGCYSKALSAPKSAKRRRITEANDE
jgi:hypothetical protein